MNKPSSKLNTLPWYEKGVSFTCTECGACCTGGPGAVWISEEDSKQIAALLDISLEQFYKTYTRLIDGRRSLLERSNYDCIFLEGKKCSIYKARPVQCQTFPFWPTMLDSKENWDAAASYCEGINLPGRTWTREEIEKEKVRYQKEYGDQ
jgi:Fe-S-cluster containining protein